jgi:hypothetical protein
MLFQKHFQFLFYNAEELIQEAKEIFLMKMKQADRMN